MAVKKFTWVNYSPSLWNGERFDPQTPILSIEAPAPPNENNRAVLNTRVYYVENSPSDDFHVFNVSHDNYSRHTAYDPDDPSSDSLIEVTSVYPIHFAAYNLKTQPGSFYATTSHNNLKDVFRRYREFTKSGHITLNLRILDVQCLERSLVDAEVVGYTLLNVSGVTPYHRLQAEGPQIDRNPEAQDFVQRAGHMQAISLMLQSGTMILKLSIRDDGSITFQIYPGDATALDVISKLESFIRGCSDEQSIQVRQRRGR